ncbi:NAD-dependent epimerase/dehydratase family protein [Dyadobacter bucti]|uniref:NAD-dependent epimerase/dehydratase family protein n=1 Tax=Dyadobacter bucti TaxID=2572203 RepID=UPI003F71D5FD
MKIAISGSDGFIGTYLTERLEGQNLTLIKLNRYNGIDLADTESITKVPAFDVLIHLAAYSFVPNSYTNPLLFYNNNINSTLNALELCRKFGASIIFMSSYVYGQPQYLPIDEDHPISSLNPYAESKIICERLIQAYNRDFGVPAIIFRPFNIYGKGQNSLFLIPLIIEQAKSGNVVLKDSRPKRDFIHVEDVVSAIEIAARKEIRDLNIYNLGSGESHSIIDVLDAIRKATKAEIAVNFTEERRPNEVLNTVSNIARAKLDLNWSPGISLAQGIAQML